MLEESKRSARQRAPGGRRLEFSEGLPLRNRSGCFGETENPPDFGSPAGYGLDESAVFGSSPQPLGPALDRQAGFTAARPAAKSELQQQTILTVVPEDRSLLTRAADGELGCASGTFRLSHDLLAQLIESG